MRVIYQMPPIDSFLGCMTMDEAAKSVKRTGVRKPVEYIHDFILSNCELLKNKEKVKDSCWEGDISQLWFFAIPTSQNMEVHFALIPVGAFFVKKMNIVLIKCRLNHYNHIK